MNISRSVALSCLLSLGVSPVFAAGFNLNDAVNAVSQMQGGKSESAPAANAGQASALLASLGSQLNVSGEQAVGGTGAMLELAKNRLSSADYSQLTQNVPALETLSNAGGLGALSGLLGQSGQSGKLDKALGNVQNTNDLNNAFGALGMDASMVTQFAPVILKYLGDQGVGGSLLQTLSGIWGTAG